MNALNEAIDKYAREPNVFNRNDVNNRSAALDACEKKCSAANQQALPVPGVLPLSPGKEVDRDDKPKTDDASLKDNDGKTPATAKQDNPPKTDQPPKSESKATKLEEPKKTAPKTRAMKTDQPKTRTSSSKSKTAASKKQEDKAHFSITFGTSHSTTTHSESGNLGSGGMFGR